MARTQLLGSAVRQSRTRSTHVNLGDRVTLGCPLVELFGRRHTMVRIRRGYQCSCACVSKKNQMLNSYLPRPSPMDDGSRDTPGIARLTRFHPALDVGNGVAAAYARDRARAYKVVLSTVVPTAASPPHGHAPELSTLSFNFNDRCGRETPAAEAVARERIVAAAKALDDALKAVGEGERILVHCSWGQNRSNAICVCWAITYANWEPEEAIAYAKETCCRERSYANPRPLHNQVFVAFLETLRPSTDGSGRTRAPTALDAWLSQAS